MNLIQANFAGFSFFIFLGRPGHSGADLLFALCSRPVFLLCVPSLCSLSVLPYSILKSLQRVPEEEVGHDSSNIPCASYISHCASLSLPLHL